MQYTYVKYAHPTSGDVIVAHEGLTPVALMYTDRHRDPRTGYMLRLKQPVVQDAVVHVDAGRFFYIIEGATHVDASVFDSKWQQDMRAFELAHARDALIHWMHREEHKIDGVPMWALIMEHEPSRPALPVPVVSKPKRVTKKKAPVLQVA